jgi:hypothetical protein
VEEDQPDLVEEPLTAEDAILKIQRESEEKIRALKEEMRKKKEKKLG